MIRLSFLRYDILVFQETGLAGFSRLLLLLLVIVSPCTLRENFSISGEGCCIKKVDGLTPRVRSRLEKEELELYDWLAVDISEKL